MAVSLLASIVMLAGKLTAYGLTHSAAILADAAESVVHGGATAFAAFSLWYSARPADRRHPYGHGKIAYLSAGFEGALVLSASVAVMYNGIDGWIHQRELENLGLGLAISGALAAINLALGMALVAVGRRFNEIVLVANGQHVLSDTWTTAASLAGVGLVLVTGAYWLDPLTAIIIGVIIMATGVSLLRQAFAGLMDEVDPELSEELHGGLQEAVASGEISDYHQLRCRRINKQIWVEVHVLLPGSLSTDAAHERVTRVEEELNARFARYDVHITSHIEPLEHDAAHPEGHHPHLDPLH